MNRFALFVVGLGIAAVPALAHTGHTRQQPTQAKALNAQTQQFAVGHVFHDRNNNGRRDRNEEGLANIRVSNQREIVRTDSQGRYRIPVTDDTIVFVIKPRGWRTQLDMNNLPKFYYIHKPAGSPKTRFPGVPPTGPLPASVDFPLYKQSEPNRFHAVLWADPQPRNQQEIDYIAHDVVAELIGTDAKFGVTLGDIMFDDLSLFHSLNRTVALIGIPWYNVIGNHDINFDAPDDRLSDETYEAVYGPNYYSFDYGPVHFVVIDDVNWVGKTSERNGFYTARIGPEQMEFIRNDLKLVPKNQMVVFMMHIPIVEATDRKELFDLIKDRPFTLSISGHTHYQEHKFLKKEDGWEGPQPHHHVINVTVSGSWWSGAPDEQGIPHTTMRDGAPNGYSIITFDGTRYSLRYKAARRPAEHQMTIAAPEEVVSAESATVPVYANVFGGSERSTVEMTVNNGEWVKMEKVMEDDPYYARLKELEAAPNPPPGRRLPPTIKSPHLWRANLPANLPAGTHLIKVRTTDMFGQKHQEERVLRVR